MIPAAPTWLSPAEAADYLRLPVKSIYRLVAQGALRAHRLGRRLRFRPQDLDAALQLPDQEARP